MPFLRARSRLREDGGFSVLESTVALVIIFGIVLTMIRTLDVGIRVLVETRRQAAASALANELLERARSLEWENTGLTAKSNDADCPGTGDGVDGVACPDWRDELGVDTVTIDSKDYYTFEGDLIVFVNEDQTFDPFLSFHQQVTRDDTVFDRYLFVTSIRTDISDAATERWRKLTAVVQWTPPSGLPKEIRQVTYVSRFEEPSQPYLRGTVVFDGGSISIVGFVEGTSDFDLDDDGSPDGTPRPDLEEATVEFPDAQVDAITDYVSGGAVIGTSPTGEVTWADGTRVVGASTGAGCAVSTYEKRADNDGTSAPPLDDPSSGPVSLDWWCLTGSEPHDFLADEENDAGTAADTTEVEGEAWTEHNPTGSDPKDDGLPYARLMVDGLQSAEMMLAAFLEYGDTEEFDLLRAGAASGPMLQYKGHVDRYETSVTARKVSAEFSWDGETVYFLGDSVYNSLLQDLGLGPFLGWVKVDLPGFSATLEAGEATSAPSWASVGDGDVVVSYFDPGSEAYVELYRAEYVSLLNGSQVLVDVDAQPGDGDTSDGPLTHSFTDLLYPDLSYEVKGEILVIPPTESVTLDSLSDRAEVILQAPGVVTGTLTYRVTDTEEGQMLYDVEISFNLGGVLATARYINPEAQ